MIRNLHSSSNHEVSPEEKAVKATLIAMSKMLKLEHRDEHLYQTPLRILVNCDFTGGDLRPYLDVITKFVYDIEPGKTHIICDELLMSLVDANNQPVYGRPYIAETNSPFYVVDNQTLTDNTNKNLAIIPVYNGVKINSNTIGLPITDPQLFKNQYLRIGFLDGSGNEVVYPVSGWMSLIVYRYTG